MDPRLAAFERLLNIMDDLRERCPWDKKQTLDSLRHLTIEETYELADAITTNDLDALKGEIGDLMLHMVFYCKIGAEKEAFDVTSVLNAICDKLVQAARIQEKVKGIGFDWDDPEDVWKKVQEELNEFHEEVEQKSDKMEEEFGDVLFSLINYARFKNINPENALARTNDKFMKRFQLMETMIVADGKVISEMKLPEMDVYWEIAKKELKGK